MTATHTLVVGDLEFEPGPPGSPARLTQDRVMSQGLPVLRETLLLSSPSALCPYQSHLLAVSHLCLGQGSGSPVHPSLPHPFAKAPQQDTHTSPSPTGW